MEQPEKRIASLRELRRLLLEDRRLNGKPYWPGFQAIVVYRCGVWREGIRSRILRAPFDFLYVLGSTFVRNFYGIELYSSTQVGRRLLLGHQHGIVISPYAVIGDDCVIIQGVTIGQSFGYAGPLPPPAPKLGNRVKVGAGAVIVGGITIGDDVTIGPNAVVMTDVPPNTTVTAPPSRIMPKMRRAG